DAERAIALVHERKDLVAVALAAAIADVGYHNVRPTVAINIRRRGAVHEPGRLPYHRRGETVAPVAQQQSAGLATHGAVGDRPIPPVTGDEDVGDLVVVEVGDKDLPGMQAPFARPKARPAAAGRLAPHLDVAQVPRLGVVRAVRFVSQAGRDEVAPPGLEEVAEAVRRRESLPRG